MSNLRWSGYVDRGSEGVVPVEFYNDGIPYVYVDGELADQVENVHDFVQDYGVIVFLTLEDYKTSNGLHVEDVWPNE